MSSVIPINLYHTNDLHSDLNQWPSAVNYIKKRREFHTRKNETSFYFDLGDHADLVHPITEATKGKGNVELMNEAGVQHATIGNNEGITLKKEELQSLYENATFKVLLANLFDDKGDMPDWALPYDIVETKEGIKIGLLGVTIPFYPFYKGLGWDIKDPYEVLPSILREVRAKADVVVLLSHLGYPQDEEIARQFNEIDVILGAHTHHLLKSSVLVNDTLIAQCGKSSYYVGRVEIWVDKESKKVMKKTGSAVDVSRERPSAETVSLVQQLRQEAEEALDETVAVLPESLSISWSEPSFFADMLTEGLRHWCKADIAMLNSGLILEPLVPGRVTKKDIHRICPHPINPCVVQVKGSVLKETIAAAFTEKMIDLPLKGFGFRGHQLGRMAFSGIEATFGGNSKESVREVFIHGKPIILDETYELATADMFTFGSLYPGLAQSAPKKYFMPETIRDILTYILKKYYPISSHTGN
ncbi:bifunctional metallophosphatase/5'-nucleotidase [Alteribacillus iranensis]|uniref:2',3'-cyclic-nucleotide 2'-phosphodiesterase/5'-or 3'-nucleotidase, 5'-nucleotidase family n=1 Tax=Alteribacillus iranensis TaxID=930128 RepID=A0A1I2EQE9_9BACI|nr:bifunctional UDP-sugar hydrolase/5'-nucleotidase [Alteribacillus iranensis]SFE94551.1 2',3'-cyclic-nucleotide 2'-phosphodiesterase/5'-or 3'-nucleotidase, 5'-nucleotidase family [Alteribacillus iranensis]